MNIKSLSKKKSTRIAYSRIYAAYVLFALITCVSLFASEVGAQTCIPPAVGVPFASGPPIWWNSAAPGSAGIYDRIDDPRWKTAASITHGAGATEEVSFRALHHTVGESTSAYMSWWIKVAPEAVTSNNIIFVGLRPSGSITTGLLLRMTLSTSSAQDTNDVQLDVYSVAADGTFGAPLAPDPSWTNNIRVWANQPVPNTWAIHVNVPVGTDLGSGTMLGNDFNMWYEVLQGTPGAPVIEYTWPRDPGFAVTEAAFVETLPTPSTWPGFHLSTGSSDPSCTTGGITIDVMDIGTDHPSGPGNISKTNVNTFFANPTNKGGGPVDVNKVHARFRLANWGTQADPNDVPPGTLWQEVRGLGNVAQSAPPASIAVNGKWNITGTWTLNAAEQLDFNGVKRWNHQCMLVELSGPGLVFLKSSVHRNMNFVSASKFREDAQVSVVGLPPIGPSERDVYLYVETKNMPRRVENSDRDRQIMALSTVDRIGMAGISKEDERSKIEKIADNMPTYVVHGYYDTGRTITVNGEARPILRSMVSYGYFVEHDGELLGWRHKLKGEKLVEMGSNFFKIAVPNNGTTTVTNTIEALEHGWAMNIRIGAGFPQGTFDNLADPGLSFNIGLEYLISSNISAEVIFGHHQFDGQASNADVDANQYSLNGRYYFPPKVVRAFVNAGIGAYDLNPGSTKFGYNVGAGAQYDLSLQWSLEAAYNYHDVNTNNPDVKFSTLQLGVRYLF